MTGWRQQTHQPVSDQFLLSILQRSQRAVTSADCRLLSLLLPHAFSTCLVLFHINLTVAPHSIYWDLAIIKFVWPWKKQNGEGVDGISGDREIRSNGTSPAFSNRCNRKHNICFSANTSVPCSRPVTPECPPNRTVSSLTSTWWSFCSCTHRCCHSPSIHTSGGKKD